MFVLHPFQLVPALLVPLGASGVLRAARRHRVPRWLAAVVALLAGEALLLARRWRRFNEFKADLRAAAHAGCPGESARSSRRAASTPCSTTSPSGWTPTSPTTAACWAARPAAHLRPLSRRQPDRRGPRPARLDSRVRARHPGRRALSPAEKPSRAADRRCRWLGSGTGAKAGRVNDRGRLEPDPVLRADATRGTRRHSARPQPARAHPHHGARQPRPYRISDGFLAADPANATAFTAEAIAKDLRALSAEGMVSIPVSIRDFPVYALRMISTVRGGSSGGRRRRPRRPCHGLSLRLERPHPRCPQTMEPEPHRGRAEILRRPFLRRLLLPRHGCRRRASQYLQRPARDLLHRRTGRVQRHRR